MSDNENLQHEYDGIIEHNNPMPTWWTWVFILSVSFAFIYYLHYEVTGEGLTLNEELQVSMKKLQLLQSESALKFVELSDIDLEKKLNDPSQLKLGGITYEAKCVMCHGENLQGKIGPNLIDDVWIHGGQPKDMLKVVRSGVAGKGMPPWEGVLKTDEVYAVLAFIKSKKQSP